MKNISALIMIALFVFLCPSLYSQNDSEDARQARTLWLKGFDIYDNAEKAVARGEFSKALAAYKNALYHFQKTRVKHPDWNKSLVLYRIKLCEKNIASIQKQIDAIVKKNKLSPGAPRKSAEEKLESSIESLRVQRLEKELAELKLEFQKALASLQKARREAARGAAAQEEIKRLVQENNRLQKTSSLLKDQYRKQQKELDSRSDERKWRERLESEKIAGETLKKSNLALKKEIQALETRIQAINLKKTEFDLEKKSLLEEMTKLRDSVETKNREILNLSKNYEQRKALAEEKDRQIASLTREVNEQRERASKLQKELSEKLEKEGISRKTKQITAENQLLRRKIDLLEAGISEKDKEIKALKKALTVSGDKVKDIERVLVKTGRDYEAYRDEALILRKKIEELQSEQAGIQEKLHKADALKEKLRKDFETISAKYKKQLSKEADFTQLAAHSLEIEEENRQLKAEKRKLTERLEKNEKEHSGTDKDLAALESQKQELLKSNEKLKSECAVKDGKIEELLEFKSKAARVDELTKSLERERSKNFALVKLNKKAIQRAEKAETSLARQQKEKVAGTENAKLTENLNNRLLESKKAKERLEEEVRELEKMSRRVAELENENEIYVQEIKRLNRKNRLMVEEPEIAKPFKQEDEGKIKELLAAAGKAEENDSVEAAIWNYSKVLEKSPENLRALSRLGIIFSEKGNDEKAVEYLDKAMRLDPDDVEKMRAAGYAYIRLGEFYKALGVVSKATALDPKNADLQRYLGIVCSYLNWTQAAERQFLVSNELDPESADTAFNLAVLLATSSPERIEEARKWYRKAVKLGAEPDPGTERLFGKTQ